MSHFRKIVIAALYLALVAMALPRAHATEAPPLKAVVWNLEWFPGRKPHASIEQQQAHMAAVQQALKALDPDIFIAEEVGDWDVFAQLVSVVPGLQVDTVSAFRQSGRGGPITRQQVAIASKLPANSTWSEPWKHSAASPPRGFAFAALTLPDHRLLFVYGLHLKSNLTTATKPESENMAKREDSAHQILAHVADMRRTYKDTPLAGVLIGGDFNTNHEGQGWHGERTLDILDEAGMWNCWSGVLPAQRLSWRGARSFPPTTFDFFFTEGLGRPIAMLGSPPKTTSDHRPVILELSITEPHAIATIPSPEDAHPH